MKNISIITAFIICFFNIAKAQTDYCKDIKKDVDPTKSYVAYYSPATYLYVNKHVADYGNHTVLSFHTTKKDADYEAYGEYIFFADGTMWKDQGAHIDCSYIDSQFGYSYAAAKRIDDDVIALLKTKKIIKVQIFDVVIPVTNEYATKFMAYMNCIDAIKK